MELSRKLRSVLALLGLGMAAASAQAASANGPYYATPSWDQQLPASTRFIVLSNWIDALHPSGGAAVLDRETGLVWEKEPSTSSFVWFSASVHCLNSNTGGRTGWRLPALPELMSLVDRSQSSPALPSGHPFTVESSVYWSATTGADSSILAYGVFSSEGTVGSFEKSRPVGLAWCVRGGPGGDTQ